MGNTSVGDGYLCQGDAAARPHCTCMFGLGQVSCQCQKSSIVSEYTHACLQVRRACCSTSSKPVSAKLDTMDSEELLAAESRPFKSTPALPDQRSLRKAPPWAQPMRTVDIVPETEFMEPGVETEIKEEDHKSVPSDDVLLRNNSSVRTLTPPRTYLCPAPLQEQQSSGSLRSLRQKVHQLLNEQQQIINDTTACRNTHKNRQHKFSSADEDTNPSVVDLDKHVAKRVPHHLLIRAADDKMGHPGERCAPWLPKSPPKREIGWSYRRRHQREPSAFCSRRYV